MSKYYAEKIIAVKCPVCGKLFKKFRTSGKRYCSSKCREQSNEYNRVLNSVWHDRANELRRKTNALPKEVQTEGYKYIRAAVLQQAVYDYKTALIRAHGGAAFSLERWFLSEWGQAISDNNGEKIIQRVRKEVYEGERKQ